MSLKRSFALLMLVGLVLVSLPGNTRAQQPQAGSGLSISPTRTELTIERGKSDVINISLKNVSGVDITAKVEINDFEADNETGEPKIIVNRQERSPTSIQPFLVGVNDIQLKKDQTKSFVIPVHIPRNASPGAYYGIIRYSAVPVAGQELEPGKVSLTASVGTIALIEVPGNIIQQIQLRGVRVFRGDTSSTLFFQSPTKVGIEIKNTGNGFSRPFGRVTITNMSGREVYSYEVNNTTPRGNILPASTRIFKDDIQNIKAPGRYTVTASISHGTGGEVLTTKMSFWYLPFWFLGIVLAVITALVLSALMIYRRMMKNHKKHRGIR